MGDSVFPARSETVIHFAHGGYQFDERFGLRETGIRYFQTRDKAETAVRIGEGHVAVLSGFWENGLLERAGRLRFVQVCAAGYDRFDPGAFAARGVRLANGSGVNKNAVSEHAMALILAFTRLLHCARDQQHEGSWQPMISDLARREEEIGGKTLLIYGLGGIGSRLAQLARAFGMRVLGIKRDPARHDGSAHEVHPPAAFLGLLTQADFVVLTCPLTDETRHLIDARALAAMAPRARLINVARGGCVDQTALLAALEAGEIAGAGLDTMEEEPLDRNSPLWGRKNVIITPHRAGETRAYEDNVIDLLLENLDRLWHGEPRLVNQLA